MSAVLALPAAVRLPRTVAVRRALLIGLFLVGFVALAVAFGGATAHAADSGTEQARGAFTKATTGATEHTGTGSTEHIGTGSAGATGSTAATASATDERSPLAGGGAALEGESDEAAAEPEAGVAQRAGARLSEGAQASEERLGEVVRPLTEGLEPVTEPVTAPVHDVVRGVGDATGLPVRLPGDTAGQDRGDERAHHDDVRDGGRQHVAAPERCGSDRTDGRLTAPSGDAGGQDRTAARADSGDAGAGQGRGGLPGQLPQGPAAPASHTTGDGNGPRGGDQHAVLPGGQPRFGLVPGGVRAAGGAPTRERGTDILEFPG
ncbi:hypothetical protein [Streptomyces niger]|uniref:hypothetical protein n=1 Tax=Streptomyces niger TaxID=66373 RepID=UPI0018FECE2C|nr:hypothetical protein [Streptomyces niger]